MAAEHVVLVDRDDKPIGTEEKIAAHAGGLLHRAFSVFVVRQVDATAQLLLQRRAATKYHFGGLWTNTCCGHPRAGEAPVAAGIRRLQEELGMVCGLEAVGDFIYRARADNGLLEHEFDHVLFGESDAEPIPNPDEVAQCRWVTLAGLDIEMRDAPAAFTPWLRPALEIARARIDC